MIVASSIVMLCAVAALPVALVSAEAVYEDGTYGTGDYSVGIEAEGSTTSSRDDPATPTIAGRNESTPKPPASNDEPSKSVGPHAGSLETATVAGRGWLAPLLGHLVILCAAVAVGVWIFRRMGFTRREASALLAIGALAYLGIVIGEGGILTGVIGIAGYTTSVELLVLAAGIAGLLVFSMLFVFLLAAARRRRGERQH